MTSWIVRERSDVTSFDLQWVRSVVTMSTRKRITVSGSNNVTCEADWNVSAWTTASVVSLNHISCNIGKASAIWTNPSGEAESPLA